MRVCSFSFSFATQKNDLKRQHRRSVQLRLPASKLTLF
jgi:hypothetical protein